MSDNSLLARARRASTDEQKLALYYELVAALAGHERAERARLAPMQRADFSSTL